MITSKDKMFFQMYPNSKCFPHPSFSLLIRHSFSQRIPEVLEYKMGDALQREKEMLSEQRFDIVLKMFLCGQFNKERKQKELVESVKIQKTLYTGN
jgi:hypothetical protein